MDEKDKEQVDLCIQIIGLASRLDDSRVRLLITSRATDLRIWLENKDKPPVLI